MNNEPSELEEPHGSHISHGDGHCVKISVK